MFLVSSFLMLFILLYLFMNHYNFWSKKRVKEGDIKTMLTDNLQILLGSQHLSVMIQRVYDQHHDVRYVGMYQFLRPVLVVKCPDLIKEICVKNFDNFQDHKNVLSETAEEIWFKNLLVLKGETWKKMRSTISPSFTSSKMRSMFNIMNNNSEAFVEHFLKKKEEIITLEMKDVLTRYTTSLIANSTLGLKVDSLEDRENEYYKMGSEAIDSSSLRRKSVLVVYQLIPTIADFLRIQLFGEHVTSFFANIVADTIKFREEQCIENSDVLGLLLEARKKQHCKKQTTEYKETKYKDENFSKSNCIDLDLTDIGIASQLFIFAIGSFETISTSLSFLVYELAVNPDVQDKLIEEIDEINICENVPSYEKILKMEYMEMVVSENLRKWPVNVATDRVTTKPHTIAPKHPGEFALHLEENTSIMIPIFAIHHDPKYHKNPEKFDPERFSGENRRKMVPYSYLPFGIGPRFCIGSRFALLAIKVLIFHLLSHFVIVPVEKTQIPIRLSKNSFSITAEDGFFVGLKRRN
ncbi:hypothetical protein WA026_010847 [Henosepilachna vigintioctopunctata]|uniref:Cytochrome P450 n=1 Tax=Henosepilachna vigintioctopunctata TaxID=420089 RepID=A0AAW1UZF1_9CUCU